VEVRANVLPQVSSLSSTRCGGWSHEAL
jgi:hypothetical protein